MQADPVVEHDPGRGDEAMDSNEIAEARVALTAAGGEEASMSDAEVEEWAACAPDIIASITSRRERAIAAGLDDVAAALDQAADCVKAGDHVGGLRAATHASELAIARLDS